MANILVVDDAAFMRLTIRKIMEPEGHTIIGEAATGIEAVQQFAELKPDVVILDITKEYRVLHARARPRKHRRT